MRPRVQALTTSLSPQAVARALVDRPGGVWLDGGGESAGMLCWSPSAVVTEPSELAERGRALLGAVDQRPASAEGRFAGGLVGWLGYEAGRWAERMPTRSSPPSFPELHLARYEGALHHLGGPRWLAAGAPDFVEAAAETLLELRSPEPTPPSSPAWCVEDGDPAAFLAGVGVALERIAAGELYQVNLARRLVLRGVSDPFAAWLRLREATPARYGAWLRTEHGALLSNSPELYLELRAGAARSLPIKGTRPLGCSVEERAALSAELEADPKERAELTMIVDLVRNDLGRVCAPGSVTAGPREVRPWPTLLHAEQEVRGQLDPDRDVFDLLAASFPPGSVTGAPKVQAMALIHELEPSRRGVYTGAIGWIADGGDARLSVAIRVAQVGGVGRPPDEARVHVGCGIVADSKPEAELAESEVKALALRAALCGERLGGARLGGARLGGARLGGDPL